MKDTAMEKVLRVLAALVLTCLTGCVGVYRTGSHTVDNCLATESGALAKGAPAGCQVAQGEYAQEGNYSYSLYYLEFDDQGWPYRRSDMARVLEEIKAKLLEDGRRKHKCVDATRKTVHLIVYVHGWKHTAHHDDGNVNNFRKLVRESASAECRTSAREVVGIYVGWRGRPVETPAALTFFDNLTFWDRKSVAVDVAQGNLREFFARLDAMVDRANATDKSKPVRMLMVGHSFGGHVLLTALGGSVLGSLASVVDDNPSSPAKCESLQVRRDGDMIVLVNPAIEGMRFEPLYAVASQWRIPCYKAPLLVAVTSTGDEATGRFFPIGRWLSTWFERYTTTDQQDMDRQALGHSELLLTHDLGKETDGGPFSGVAPAVAPCSVVWQTATPDIDAAVQAEFRNHRDFMRRQQAGEATPESPRAFCAGAILVPRAGKGRMQAQWRGPLMNIRVRPSLVPNHNDIYDARFVSFLRELYMDTLVTTFRAR